MFSALLGLATLLGAVVTMVAVFGEGRSAMARAWLANVRANAVWLMFAVTAGAMVGSLYFSEIVNYSPCKLCWYQRIAMYAIAIITLVAALRKDKKIAPYTLALASVGLVVSMYHYPLEWFPNIETSVCSVDVPCTTIWFREFGFVTLSFIAGSAFLFVISLSLALLREQTETPS